eukprot:gene133-204_t
MRALPVLLLLGCAASAALAACVTTCGAEVPHGWNGTDDGANGCNTCRCEAGAMRCSNATCGGDLRCLAEGSVCRSDAEGSAWDRSHECPKGTQCLPQSFAFAGWQVYACREVAPCAGDEHCGAGEWCRPAPSGPFLCGGGKGCVPKAKRGELCGESALLCKLDACEDGLACVRGNPAFGSAAGRCLGTCKTTCGKTVWEGWQGRDDGPNACNDCTCEGGGLVCTYTACADLPCLGEGDECKSGGVETGPGFDRTNECPDGTSCKVAPDTIAIGSEAPKTCQRDVPCSDDTDCAADEWCRPEQASTHDCAATKICTPRLGEGGPCSSERLPCFSEKCKAGLSCVPGFSIMMMADPPGVCQVVCKTACGRTVVGGWSGNDDGPNACNTCSCDQRGFVCTETACDPSLRCLLEGDVCWSGGVETGPVVDRSGECPHPTTCKVAPDVVAIGGEVPMTCQRAGVVCLSDADCAVSEWCRPEQNAQGSCGDVSVGGTCVPRVGLGSSCGGDMIQPCFVDKCEEHLACIRGEMTIDGAGVCKPCTTTCGHTVPRGWQGRDDGRNGCNTCVCEESGMVCTALGCGSGPFSCPRGAGDSAPGKEAALETWEVVVLATGIAVGLAVVAGAVLYFKPGCTPSPPGTPFGGKIEEKSDISSL